jgi:hypothetical protein
MIKIPNLKGRTSVTDKSVYALFKHMLINEHLNIFTQIYVTGFKIVKKPYEFLRYGRTPVNQNFCTF